MDLQGESVCKTVNFSSSTAGSQRIVSKIDKSRKSRISMLFKYTAVSSRKNKMISPRRKKLINYLQNAIISLRLITWFEKSALETLDAAAFTSPSPTRGHKATSQEGSTSDVRFWGEASLE